MDLAGFALSIGHAFRDESLLRLALTHRSYAAGHNERLEFLGDSVLNCAIALELYHKFPHLSEGDLSRLRAGLVSQPALAQVAERIRLGQRLLLGEGEVKSGGARRPSILADALEAVIGATFLDAGFDAARDVVRTLFASALEQVNPQSAKDPETLLQELLQGRRLALPQYTVVATHGEAHDQRFDVECLVLALNIRTRGSGTSRRAAEQAAAHDAYQQAIAK
ncbi:MAG TPA: ribonuclease III [Burkholderiales bacterium]|nr:ribonuclease III [Burkholderiales bacterium]